MNGCGIFAYKDGRLGHFSLFLPSVAVQIFEWINLLTVVIFMDLAVPKSAEDEDSVLDGLVHHFLFQFQAAFEVV